MQPLSASHFFLAVFIGFLSSGSLTLGALTGVLLQPNSFKTGVLYSFGAGALLTALAVVLIAPTVASVKDPAYLALHGRAQATTHLIVLAFLSLVGGLTFILLDEVFSNRSSELRKLIKQMKHMGHRPMKAGSTRHAMLCHTSGFFQALDAEQREKLSREMRYVCYHSHDVIFNQGDATNRVWIIKSGSVQLQMRPGECFHCAERGELLGSVAFLTGEAEIMTAVAGSDVEAYSVEHRQFISLLDSSPDLKLALLSDVADLLGRILSANTQSFKQKNSILHGVIADHPPLLNLSPSPDTFLRTGVMALSSVLDGPHPASSNSNLSFCPNVWRIIASSMSDLLVHDADTVRDVCVCVFACV